MKLIYIDTETTGLDSRLHALTEIACIVVEDGEIIDKQLLYINPSSYTKMATIDPQALEFRNVTIEEVEAYPSSKDQFNEFIAFLDKHIDKYDKQDKFKILGYNIGFDIGFIKEWFIDNDHKYYGSYFDYKDIDVFALVKHLKLINQSFETENDKLETLCKYFGIGIDAHNALSDIEATRELYKRIVSRMSDLAHFSHADNII